MSLSITELGYLVPAEGWPDWVATVPYVGSAHPQSGNSAPISLGANCQRFAYAVLGLFGTTVPPHRSSQLWADPAFDHVTRSDVRELGLVLFNPTADSWGAHVAVALGGQLLHLCAEVGRPALWQWSDFAARERYATLFGVVRVQERER